MKSALEGGLDPNASFLNKRTLLQLASKKGDLQMVRLLLAKGADPNALSMLGESALSFACVHDDEELVKVLLEHGADPNTKLLGLDCPLVTAAALGNRSAVAMFLDRQADPNAKGLRGRTALIAASSGGHPEVVSLLLDRGADPRLADKLGIDALGGALLCLQEEAARRLLARGLDFTLPDDGTPEHRLCRAFHDKMKLEALVEASGVAARNKALGALRQQLFAIRSDFETAARDNKKKAQSSAFWNRLKAAMVQGFAEGVAHGMLNFQRSQAARSQYRQMAQITALRDSNTPQDYFNSYHYLMSKQPDFFAETARVPATGSQTGIPPSAYFKSEALRMRAEVLTANVAVVERFIADIDKTLAPGVSTPGSAGD